MNQAWRNRRGNHDLTEAQTLTGTGPGTGVYDEENIRRTVGDGMTNMTTEHTSQSRTGPEPGELLDEAELLG